MAKIGVLYPKVANIEEYNQISIQLTNIASELLVKADDDTPDDEFKSIIIQINAHLIYNEFSVFATQHNRAMYMTWDELRKELDNLDNLDDAIRYLLQNGYLEEGFEEL